MVRFRLEFPGSVESLGRAARFVQEVCASVTSPELPCELVRDIGLVISEGVTNAIRHGTRSDDELLTVIIEIANDRVFLRVRDRGPGFDIDDIALPDFDDPAEGGYGIFIIKSLMDEVRYERGTDWNELLMIKLVDRNHTIRYEEYETRNS